LHRFGAYHTCVACFNLLARYTQTTLRTNYDPDRGCPPTHSRTIKLLMAVPPETAVVHRMSDYIKGSRLLHNPGEDEGLNLSFMGIPHRSMAALNYLQRLLQGEQTPCYGKPQCTSGKAGDKAYAIAGCLVCPIRPACAEFADINGETGAVWGGIAR